MKVIKTRSPTPNRLAGPTLLFIILAILFWKAFLPDYVVFSNDGPLGLQNSAWLHLPKAYLGQWFDLNTVGTNAGASLPDVDSLIRWLFGPLGCSKFLAPAGLWILGFGAWFFFRRSGLSSRASVLGGLAACLTTGFFSNACWGAVPSIIAFGMNFFALGALAKRDKLPFWVAPALAGLAVGVNVMEAADIGALFSFLVAAFVVYQSLAENGSSILLRTARGIGRTIIVAAFAGFIAGYAVSAFIGTSVKGVAGTEQDVQTKAVRWDFATQWSVPKRETLALLVPNIFGCSVITPGEANYWGGIGMDSSWDRYLASGKQGPPPQGFLRHTGRGIYLGIFCSIVALWASLQSLRKMDSAFTPMERKLIWFWSAAALVSLLLAHGRNSPFSSFYYWIYTVLPYSSTIRSPEKFLHIVTFSTVILFAYGVHGLNRRYLEIPLSNNSNSRLKSWWTKAAAFDKRWVIGTILAVVLSIAGWVIYGLSRHSLEHYLQDVQFSEGMAHEIAGYSIRQAGWFVLFLIAGSGLLLAIFSGALAGRRAKTAGILLGLIMAGDLVRADLPYITFVNYKEKYEVNSLEPVIQFLRDKPYEHRVAYLLSPPLSTPSDFGLFQYLYNIEWTQQLFPYYNIQTLDIVQMPRMPQDLVTFGSALRIGIKQNGAGQLMLDETTFYRLPRLWELTNTRYLLGPAPLLDTLNTQFDPQHRFRIIQKFEVGARPGINNNDANKPSEWAAVPNENGRYALFEFTGALPRVKLYSNWQVNTNDEAVLKELVDPSFNPAQTVLINQPLSASTTASATNQNLGTVDFVSYAPAEIKLKANAATGSVLLLNDKYDQTWQVFVDGKRAELLRCNFIMRGVYLEPGQHEVEFQFKQPPHMLYINIAAILVGLGLLGYVAAAKRREKALASPHGDHSK